jgi:hypothetical protein
VGIRTERQNTEPHGQTADSNFPGFADLVMVAHWLLP